MILRPVNGPLYYQPSSQHPISPPLFILPSLIYVINPYLGIFDTLFSDIFVSTALTAAIRASGGSADLHALYAGYLRGMGSRDRALEHIKTHLQTNVIVSGVIDVRPGIQIKKQDNNQKQHEGQSKSDNNEMLLLLLRYSLLYGSNGRPLRNTKNNRDRMYK